MRSWYGGTRNGPLSLFSDFHPRVGRRHESVASSTPAGPAGWSPGAGADRRQHKSRGARATDRRRRRRNARPHAVLVRRKRERALFAAGKNRTASADGNRLGEPHEALFNGNRKRDRGHRLRWCVYNIRLRGGGDPTTGSSPSCFRFIIKYYTILLAYINECS